MKDELKQFLNDYCTAQGWAICESPEDFEELLNGAKEVYSETTDSARHYDRTFNVVEINGKFIGFDWFHITGDNSASDMGLELDLSSICECEKIEKTITAYEPI